MKGPCPRCGSKKVMPNLPVKVEVHTAGGPGGGDAVVVIGYDPRAWTTKDMVRGALTATVCGECGHAVLEAGNFRNLYEKYEQTRRS